VSGQGFQATIDFAGDAGFAVGHFDLAGKGDLGQVGQRSQHLAGLVAVVVNGLLAQDDQAGLFFVDQGFEQLGHGQGLQLFGGFDQDGTVGADGHGGAQGFLALGDAARHRDDFGDHALFFQAHGFFDGDFVKRVHAHLDVGNVHTGVVRLDSDLHVVVHHAFDWDEDLHAGLAPQSS
jgi:hypothetical protein